MLKRWHAWMALSSWRQWECNASLLNRLMLLVNRARTDRLLEYWLERLKLKWCKCLLSPTALELETQLLVRNLQCVWVVKVVFCCGWPCTRVCSCVGVQWVTRTELPDNGVLNPMMRTCTSSLNLSVILLCQIHHVNNKLDSTTLTSLPYHSHTSILEGCHPRELEHCT